MARVDSKGRVTIPKKVRDSLEIEEGSRVEIQTENGHIVVKPERDPEYIIDKMNSILEGIERTGSEKDLGLIAEEHIQNVRTQTEKKDE